MYLDTPVHVEIIFKFSDLTLRVFMLRDLVSYWFLPEEHCINYYIYYLYNGIQSKIKVDY